jgi:F-type H+-transporting ATPase subunit gamma
VPSLKDLRNRIGSVKATQKITRAMQMVAAAKLRRAQEQAEAARPYAERMGAVLANLARSVRDQEGAPRLLAGTGAEDTHLLVVATADRGLCGGFNSNIARKARADAAALIKEGRTVKILCVGRKGFDVLKRQFERNIIDTISLRHVREVGFANAQEIGRRVVDMFDAGEFDVCTLYYAHYRSVISQEPTAQRLIPATIEADGDNGRAAPRTVYDFEPDEAEIMAELLPLNLNVQVFKALLENAASEQGARMTAMDNATRNAGEMIDKLTLNYNRTRQAQITKELIEIISGAEAL